MELTVSADDFGLSKGVTDTILDTVDRGPVTNVSILANGTAFEYAIEEFLKRREVLTLSVHLNVTEGGSVAPLSSIPLLVGPDGNFKYSVGGLWVAYTFSTRKAAFRTQIGIEVRAQIQRVRDALRERASIFSLNGHQHVHMLPFIRSVVTESEPRIAVRFPHEPFSAPNFFALCRVVTRIPGWFVLSILARTKKGLALSEYFIGVLYSGAMTFAITQAALQRVQELSGRSVEVLFHPGSAVPGELDRFNASKKSLAWHFSPWRARERALLLSKECATLLHAGSVGTLRGLDFLQRLRFIVAGIIATSTNLGFLYLFTAVLGVWYIASAIIAFGIATGVGFVLQKFWAFEHRSLKNARREVLFFVSNNILGLTFDAVGLYLLVEYVDMWYLAAQFLLLAIVALWNFFVYRYFLFALAHRPT